MTRPVRLLVRPSGDSILKIGAISMTSGNIWVSSISRDQPVLAAEGEARQRVAGERGEQRRRSTAVAPRDDHAVAEEEREVAVRQHEAEMLEGGRATATAGCPRSRAGRSGVTETFTSQKSGNSAKSDVARGSPGGAATVPSDGACAAHQSVLQQALAQHDDQQRVGEQQHSSTSAIAEA